MQRSFYDKLILRIFTVHTYLRRQYCQTISLNMQLSKTSQLADFFRQFDQIVLPQYELKCFNLDKLIENQQIAIKAHFVRKYLIILTICRFFN